MKSSQVLPLNLWSPLWNLLLILVVTATGGVKAQETPQPLPDQSISEQMIGSWKFIGFEYRGDFHPPINPKLVLLFRFFADGTDDLFWTRIDEPGFCERKGIYSVSEKILTDKVTWLNPENAMDCSKDPDMQVGRETHNEVDMKDGKFRLILSLGDEPFVYVWERYQD